MENPHPKSLKLDALHLLPKTARSLKLYIVLITAFGVGGATIIGALIGFFFRGITSKFADVVLAFSAGVMLVAAMSGLIIPSLELGGRFALPVTVIGVLSGAVLIYLLNKSVPYLNKIMVPANNAGVAEKDKINKIILFILAIAIHNLPEGIAAGVGFGTENIGDTISVAIGIALQNIPEGMVIISPMLSCGISPKRTFVYAALTGVIEIIGTLIGYFAVSVSSAILPFALALAGGTMIYVISDEIIPDTHREENNISVTFALLLGFCLMLTVNFYI